MASPALFCMKTFEGRFQIAIPIRRSKEECKIIIAPQHYHEQKLDAEDGADPLVPGEIEIFDKKSQKYILWQPFEETEGLPDEFKNKKAPYGIPLSKLEKGDEYIENGEWFTYEFKDFILDLERKDFRFPNYTDPLQTKLDKFAKKRKLMLSQSRWMADVRTPPNFNLLEEFTNANIKEITEKPSDITLNVNTQEKPPTMNPLSSLNPTPDSADKNSRFDQELKRVVKICSLMMLGLTCAAIYGTSIEKNIRHAFFTLFQTIKSQYHAFLNS